MNALPLTDTPEETVRMVHVRVVSDDAARRPALAHALTTDEFHADHATVGGLLSQPAGPIDLVVLDLDETEDVVADAVVQLRTHIRGPVIVVIHDAREPSLLAPLAAGARGVVLASSGAAVVRQATSAVHEGGVFIDPALGGVLVELLALTSSPHEETNLTPAELRVLRRFPQGMTNPEIAADLGISVNTIKTHVRRILAKLDCDDRVQAMQAARAKGLLP